MSFILSIDQGTTGTTAVVWDFTQPHHPRCLAIARHEIGQNYPKPGWVEEDLEEIFLSVRSTVTEALGAAQDGNPHFTPQAIGGIGITNQRETLCVFDRKTGKPLAKALVWQCKRSLGFCEELKASGLEPWVRQKTGLFLDPYFSGSKIPWLVAHVSELKTGSACLSTVDSYLLHRLTGGKTFATDPSNASRTLLYDLDQGGWDQELAQVFFLPSLNLLPEIRDSAGDFGKTLGLDFLPDGIPITGILGDQQAALGGQGCITPGMGKCTYGTGAFLLTYQGTVRAKAPQGVLETLAWQLKGERHYALEGSSFIAGAAVQFLRDQMGFLESAQESEGIARGVEAAAQGIYFVPALSGLGAPYWNPKARGAILGLTRGTTQAQLVRAGLEGIAFQVGDLVRGMGTPLEVLRVDGGASQNSVLCQIQADLLGKKVERPQILETTSLGAGIFGALGAGIIRDLTQMSADTWDVFHPGALPSDTLWDGWRRAIQAVSLF
jgi:glycerol kinase